jgi:acetylornithine deacetylase/succinyl-diaminopimelate desuccinylase-like protein
MKKVAFAILYVVCSYGICQDSAGLKSQVRHSIDELRDFVAIPNDALEHADINRNISWLTRKFNERGFNTSVLPTSGESLFFAALPMEDEKPTILFYMHFDGQSVEPSKWEQPNPYEVVLKAKEGEAWRTRAFY